MTFLVIIVGWLGLRRRLLAAALIFMVLAVLAVPLYAFLSEYTDREDLVGEDLTFRVKSDVDESRRVRGGFVPGEVLVKFVRGASETAIANLRIGQGAEELYVSPFNSVRRWRVPPARSVEEWVDFFDGHPLVEYAEPNFIMQALMVPDDPGYPFQWHLENSVYGGINMEAAWDMVTGSTRVVVAVVDTGVAYEDFVGPGFWHLDSYNAYGGSGHSWWCGVSTAPSSWTGLYGTNPKPPGYGNGWRQYLQHSVDLTVAVGTVTLSYYYKYDVERNYDFFYVDVSEDDGFSWIELKSYTNLAGPPGGRDVDWTQESVDLTDYAGNDVLIRFRFNSDDEGYSDEDGLFNSDGAVYIDEVEVVDDYGQIFYDNMEGGVGEWETTRFMQAPDLSGTSFLAGWDFVNNDAHANDDNGHGTHVTGTIAQTTNNGFGVAGVAFGTTIMPVKVLNAAGIGPISWIADGIYYATDNGADIVNLSLGGSSASTTLENAVAYAYNNGVVVVASSGNENAAVGYPAAYDDYVIAVGATQYNEIKAPYSNYGASLDLVAPGGNTGVDLNGDGYADGVLQNTFGNTTVDWAYWFWQGTSMAAPHVSGVAALVLARNPALSPDELRSVLESTAEDLGSTGWDSQFGWGLVDARAALESVAEPVHLLLSVDPSQTTYASGQSLTLAVTVFNEFNPPMESTLTLTVTGPSSYYLYDFQPIELEANEVKDYSFSWTVPDFAGTYTVEVGLVPAQLTAYDAVWLEVD